MRSHLRFFCVFCTLFLVAGAIYGAQREAAAWPSKPVRMLVPFAPGGATDIVARILAPALSEALGQQFVVDNRAGASGNIALEMAAHAQPDGHTILVSNVATSAINPTGFAHLLKFDPAAELSGVVMVASVPSLLCAGMAFPPNNMKELIAYAKARPGQLNYSSPMGNHSHLIMLDLQARTGIEMVNVPSKGAGAAYVTLITGEIHIAFQNAATVTNQIRAGRLKALVTNAKLRLAELPDVPTMTESGYPSLESVNWNGLFVPAKTPHAVIEKLNAAVNDVMQRAAVLESFRRSNVPVTLSKTPGEFQAFVRVETARWAKIIKDNNVVYH
jgi:tripartite-type tricarboxylate transporter receptor subunit TctC